MHTTRVNHSLSIFMGAAIFYAAFYSLNDAVIRNLSDLPGIDLFRLSSGVKLLLVLLTGWLGSAAIGAFCFIWCALFAFPDNYLLSAQIATAGGLVPLLACLAFRRQLLPDLSGLNWQRLFQLSFVFAAINSLVREVIVFLHLREGDLIENIGQTFVNDLLGIFFAMYAFRFVLVRLNLPARHASERADRPAARDRNAP